MSLMQAALTAHPLLSKSDTHLVDRHPGVDGCSFRQRLNGYGEPACSRCAVPVQRSCNAKMLCQASCRLAANGQKCTAPTIILVDKLLEQFSEPKEEGMGEAYSGNMLKQQGTRRKHLTRACAHNHPTATHLGKGNLV